jgi:hypothetical protein
MPPRWPEPYEPPPGREHLAERWLPAFAQRELTQTHSRVISRAFTAAAGMTGQRARRGARRAHTAVSKF